MEPWALGFQKASGQDADLHQCDSDLAAPLEQVYPAELRRYATMCFGNFGMLISSYRITTVPSCWHSYMLFFRELIIAAYDLICSEARCCFCRCRDDLF